MLANNNQSPDRILADYADTDYGASVRTANITAVVALSDMIQSTLGPQGMDKMVIDKTYDITGEVIITNDGATILDEIEVENDTVQLAIEVAMEQEQQVGDGTTTAVLLVGALLREASDLIEKGIHPSTIVEGYRVAATQARNELETLGDEAAEPNRIDPVTTAMSGKSSGVNKKPLAELILDGVDLIADGEEVHLENVKTIARAGGAIGDSRLIEGVLLEKERVHPNMPKSVTDTSIALYDGEIRNHDNSDRTVMVNDAEELNSVIENEDKRIEEMVSTFLDVGADVVLVRKFLNDYAQSILANHGVFAVRQVDLEDIQRVSRATGAEVVGDLDTFSEADLGHAGRVEQREIAGRQMVQIPDIPDAKSVSLLLRGGTEHVLEELERTVEDGLAVAKTLRSDGRGLPGAGATEIELARRIRGDAAEVPGRKQLAVTAFADALEIIPGVLVTNAGRNRIDTLTQLYSAHENGKTAVGVTGPNGTVGDAFEAGVVDLLPVKRQAIESATDVAAMVLRVDGMVRTESLTQEEEDELVERVEKGEDREKARKRIVRQRD